MNGFLTFFSHLDIIYSLSLLSLTKYFIIFTKQGTPNRRHVATPALRQRQRQERSLPLSRRTRARGRHRRPSGGRQRRNLPGRRHDLQQRPFVSCLASSGARYLVLASKQSRPPTHPPFGLSFCCSGSVFSKSICGRNIHCPKSIKMVFCLMGSTFVQKKRGRVGGGRGRGEILFFSFFLLVAWGILPLVRLGAISPDFTLISPGGKAPHCWISILGLKMAEKYEVFFEKREEGFQQGGKSFFVGVALCDFFSSFSGGFFFSFALREIREPIRIPATFTEYQMFSYQKTKLIIKKPPLFRCALCTRGTFIFSNFLLFLFFPTWYTSANTLLFPTDL